MYQGNNEPNDQKKRICESKIYLDTDTKKTTRICKTNNFFAFAQNLK